ncbi:hypothetical protein ACET3Z_014576 [Daucus carota]
MNGIRDQRHNSTTSRNAVGGNQHISKDKGILKMTSPNVVARLMGLDVLPSPEVIHRPQKTLAGNNRHRSSPRRSQSDDHLCEAQSYHQKGSVEKPQFKDVFEDTSKKSVGSKNPKVELHQQSDSLIPEHPCRHRSPSSYQISVLKPSNPGKQKTKAEGWKAERGSQVKDDIVSQLIHVDDFLRRTYGSPDSQNSAKSSIIPADRKSESDIIPKRIVILKPNYVMAQNASNSFLSPDSSNFDFSDYCNHKDYASTLKSEYYFRDMEIRKDVVNFRKPRSRKVTKRVLKATRDMRDTSSYMMNNRDTANKFGENTGDDIGVVINSIPSYVDMRDLYDFSGNVFANESEGMKSTSCDLRESFVTSEAKKRLLKRLKKAQKYKDARDNSKESMLRDVGVNGKKITLGEMLSTRDANIRNLDVKMSGINRRDGWNDSYSKPSSSSRSVHPLHGRTSEKQNADGEFHVDDKLLIPKDATNQYRRKVPKRYSKKKDKSTIKNSRSSKSIAQSDHLRCVYNSESLLESCSSQDQMEINLNNKVSPDEQLVIPRTPSSAASIEDAENIQHGSGTQFLGASGELHPELSICMEKYDYFFVGDQENSTPQRNKAEAESAESSKEADNPSPVSVLEVTLREGDVLSCPESFDQVSADLRELQKQLQLLKRESTLYAGDPILNDCDAQQGPVTSFENVGIHKHECWESSYIIDVLTESGFHDTDTDTFLSTCYSPDCPLGPWVFDNLENRLRKEVTGLKHARRLLFDRINSALSEIPGSFMDPFPWLRQSSTGIRFRWQKCDINDKLHELLEGQEKDAYEDVLEKLLDKEMNWVGSRDFVDAIGIEIEKVLTDELLTELVNEVAFN